MLEEDVKFSMDLTNLGKRKISEKTINQFALNVMGQVEDRMFSYIYDQKGFDAKLNRIFRQISLSANITNESPILSNMEQQ